MRCPSVVTAGAARSAASRRRRSVSAVDAGAGRRDRRVVGVEPEAGAAAVENGGGALGDVERRVAGRDQGRQAERAGEDGGVRGRAAARGDEADDAGGVEADGVGRREVVGDQDHVAIGEGRVGGREVRHEVGEHPAADVAQVGGAGGEQRIAHGGEAARGAAHRLLPRPGRAVAVDHELAGEGDEVGVGQELGLGLEDAGLRGAQPAGGVVGQHGELLPGGDDRLVELAAGFDERERQVRDRHLGRAQHVDAADGETGRGGHAGDRRHEGGRRPAAAPAPAAALAAALAASVFSWRVRPVIAAFSAASASAAPSPSAETTMRSPLRMPSRSSETRLRGSATSSPARIWMRARLRRAVSTQWAAGRAWRPLG